MAYLCPLCQQPLTKQNHAYTCENHHQFDIAKEGYVNLMPAHHKRSKDPGDNKEMTQARRRFLNGGHYHPMRARVAELVEQFIYQPASALLDIGCGEGYYTSHIADTLLANEHNMEVHGLDISKVAVRYAAKRYLNCQFTVASSHRLPFASESLDAVIRIYAPCKPEELLRCVKPGGIIVTVTPAARHLYQLKEKIYQSVRLHDETPELLTGFVLEHSEKIHYDMSLPGSEARDLLQMTPLEWHASDEFRAQLEATGVFSCEADFMLRIYRKPH
ncbi:MULTISPECIES: 23S rRNA (guanine(745)-N(1))-methyltransferase [Vibrio]|uniref:23S rRNA (Guanine(745)-N(1))-methyltransferase n=2 Tax=Vibrio TaxID=662 RepID=A0A7X4LK94_9VIBR|nr:MULTISPECIES: 23S rRNA (guanine(745)-N(1))-methyltransferase [Vibrio]MBF8999899.1 23S rRNA (guanine(745)-N(1))-methyltransferase [Vibrio nitrifigilis]MZI93469.1 23S rRNA (guanine(745)-N(1))-methyltransferase [Vibrio eleionomae]